MKGVFLDTETVNPEQLDFSALEALMSWTFYPFTDPAQRVEIRVLPEPDGDAS